MVQNGYGIVDYLLRILRRGGGEQDADNSGRRLGGGVEDGQGIGGIGYRIRVRRHSRRTVAWMQLYK